MAKEKWSSKEVYFSYPSIPNTPVLQGLNLTTQAGKTVGFVGGSGSGKSTIISLLERFYDLDKGKILLDGYDIKRLQLKWLRPQMGLVNQEPVLFATSIKENILFEKEGAAMEHVISAAKTANAHDFIVKLPDGYDTQVGQFGVQLSGGQKQRVAIARALLRNPRILLLDEATSALDAQSESIVQEALDHASIGRTTLIVAHRLTTICKADLVVVLQSGKVIESGSHEELMHMKNGEGEEGGAYSKMVHLQQLAMQNVAPNGPRHPAEDISHLKMMTSVRPSPISIRPSPISIRSSWQNSPAHQFSSVYSLSIADISQLHLYGNFNYVKQENTSYPPPSQLRLYRMNAPEWKQALLGCLRAAGFGAVQAFHSYCMGSIASVYFQKELQGI
ncbi:unnamed protein product [Prunus armeniaca]